MEYHDINPPMNRLIQLIDSTVNIQTDVIKMGKQMDDKDKEILPIIDKLLKERGLATVDDLIEKVKAKMTPEEKKQFEALINAVKKAQTKFDWGCFIAGIMMLPEGGILGVKGAIAAGRLVFRAQFIQRVAGIFEIAQVGGDREKVSKAVDEVAKAASSAAKELEEAGEIGEAGAEIAEAVSMMSKIKSFCKILGKLDFVIIYIPGILELIVDEKERRDKLIEDIHLLQTSRLSTYFFKSEATNISQQLDLIVGYVKVIKENPTAAKTLSNQIVHNITAANSKINLTTLEKELEAQDKDSPSYYGDADLSTAEVVKLAESDKWSTK